MIRVKKKCDKCGRDISLSNFTKHYRSCQSARHLIVETESKEKIKRACPFCKKTLTTNTYGLKAHLLHCEAFCKQKDCKTLKQKNIERGNTAWNKGLTKSNDERVLQYACNLAKKFATVAQICWHYHIKECVVCKEKNVVAIHHYDANSTNDHPMNLVPLCPTHHVYWHSNLRCLIQERIEEYVKLFRVNFKTDEFFEYLVNSNRVTRDYVEPNVEDIPKVRPPRSIKRDVQNTLALSV